MNKFKRITMSAILCMIMIISLATVSFANQVIYEEIEDEVISSGVTHKNILRFGKGGWLNINALYVDLDDTSIRLEIVQSPEGLSHREPLSQMVGRYDNVIGAINGDFFHVTTPAAPTGVVVRDGKLISSPEPGGNSLATLFIGNNNQAWVDYWKFNLSIVTDKGNTIHLGNINKFSKNYLDIALIDRNWGTHSPGFAEYYEDITEVVVIDDVVTEVRRKQPSVEIPEDGYIILATQLQAPGLFDSLEVGDRLTIKQDLGKSIEDIKMAIGGGTALVKDGKIVSFTQSVSGDHPRTAIGITRDRSELILVTIDGRHTSYKGVDGRQLAEMMIELGSYEAIIMDGGGSTTMMKRSPGDFEARVINHPSDGVERKIINGIAVVSTAPAGSLRGIKAEIDNEKIFAGTPYKIDVKAFDKNYNPMKINYSKVNFSLKSGEGNFSGTNFIPTEPGKTVIGVEYLGAVSEVILDVLPPGESQEGAVAKDSLNKPYEVDGEKIFIHSGIQFKNYTLLD
ncbi:MAG: phosphodiester glycosidase family protein, partial [Clostridiales bacterium]|nr:phosphodiester glycosidase family protein [Clostridiales bacterium]